ncbi:protein-PII uridylyltransferase [Janibacter sp. Soil728]|uniref:[protein-PII] uridylyltransferase n=1 Tax=Janibacter sp. Soil728 TaxID=1736393 RepID=UPI0006FAF7E2|nr:[protein-PII] uridylyltransferase [Janibacter sp. Soil728]KRE38503.1 protein-PII uridylyltransferase [Janibacter sp. Soil728]
MTATGDDLRATRLDLAGTREFTLPGAGPARRAAIADATRAWLGELYAGAVGEHEGIALAAVGSLGRGTSGPLSDLDLVLVHDGRSTKGESLTEMADRLWYPIWDSGLSLDHSVRSSRECRDIARHDLSAAVGLLDLSLVAGDEELVAGVRATVAHDWRSGARTRLPQFVESVRARHHRHGELSQQVEPDLKEALGGLRDVTVLDALTRAWLTDRPHGSVGPALERLLDVRDALHVVTGRGRDRLLREEHDAVAALLGLADRDELLTTVSTSARTIAWALEATMRRAGQSQRARTLRVGPRRPTMTPLGHGLFVHDGEAVLGSTRLASADPTLPLRAAVVAARAGLPLSPQTLTNLAACPDPSRPWSQQHRDLLTDLLAAGRGLPSVWEGLDQVGVVERWLPEWAAVRGRPQHHPIHRHTVERHLLETVSQATVVGRDVARADLLHLAALLHDIGKIAGARDHSRTGGDIADLVLRRWGLPDEERATVVLLVREHLTLIETATRRDLSDPATVDSVCRLVGEDPQTFELLRALTIADARAAGPVAWTDWRASLLDSLTGLVRERLTGRAPHLPPLAPAPTMDPTALEDVTAGRVHVRVEPGPGGWTVTVHCRDRVGLFADTAGLLAAHGMTVRRARLATTEGIAVDEWFVESPGGDAPETSRLAAGLTRLEAGDRAALTALSPRRNDPMSSVATAGTSAFVLPSAGSGATVLEVRSHDRAGLLHDLGRALTREGLRIRSAHISTFAGQTLDTFYVTDAQGRELAPAAVGRAVSAVIDACDTA